MQQLQTTTDQYPQKGFDEIIIYALANKMYKDSDGLEFSTEEIFKIYWTPKFEQYGKM